MLVGSTTGPAANTIVGEATVELQRPLEPGATLNSKEMLRRSRCDLASAASTRPLRQAALAVVAGVES